MYVSPGVRVSRAVVSFVLVLTCHAILVSDQARHVAGFWSYFVQWPRLARLVICGVIKFVMSLACQAHWAVITFIMPLPCHAGLWSGQLRRLAVLSSVSSCGYSVLCYAVK